MTVDAMRANELNEQGSRYGGGFFWGPNGTDGESATYSQTSAGVIDAADGDVGFPTNEFGFQLVCSSPNDCKAPNAYFDVGPMVLSVEETQSPSISIGGLWGQPGWVRGRWPIIVEGDSPSGVCDYGAAISGDPVGASATYGANQTVWHQCSSGGLSGTLNTAQAPDGTDSLSASDSDAAGLSAAASEAIHVDNVTPTLSLSGPATASTSSGAQHVTATVNTGPSGAYGSQCSVDGGPSAFYPGATASVPVSGLGPDTVTCIGESNAISSDGARAASAPASFTIDFQQPTVEGITFSHLADALRCHTTVRRVLIRGRRYVIDRHGHRIVVYSRTRRVRRRVRSCHARSVHRRVLVVLKRHGQPVYRRGHIVRVRRRERIVLLPHRVDQTSRLVRHGRGTTVSGYLGLSDGTPLGDQPVTIIGADNENGAQFVPVSSATTNVDGVWVARIPAGPSRVLEAVYAGNDIDAGVTSTDVTLAVPARIDLSISPHILPWTGTITIRGRLVGGDVPPDGVALRFLVRYPHSSQRSTLLALRTNALGSFRFTWSYHGGRGVASYPFSIATTAAEDDYPFAAASSARVAITFGRPTPRAQRPHHRHRRRHRHHRPRQHHHRRRGRRHQRRHHRRRRR